MITQNGKEPTGAERLGQPVVLLDFDGRDTKSSAALAVDAIRQAKAAYVHQIQVHDSNGAVHAIALDGVNARDELVRLFDALFDSPNHFYVVAVARPMPAEASANIFAELADDTIRARIERGYKAKFPGVVELRTALLLGYGAELIDLDWQTHRRTEIAATVAQILAVPADRYPDAERIRSQAIRVLKTIDGLLASRAAEQAA